MKIDSVKIQNYNIKPKKIADKSYKNSLYSTAINFNGKDVFVKNKQTFKNPLKKIMAVIMGFIIPAKFNIEKTDYASEEFKTLPPKEQREYLRRKFGSDSNFGEYNVNKIISKIKNNENLPLLYKLYNILPSVVEKNAAANIIFNAKEKDIESKIEIAKRLPQKDGTNFNYIILSEINNKNLPFAKQLMSDKRLERKDIAIILRNMENKDIDAKTKVFNILKNTPLKNFSDAGLSTIIRTTKTNLPLAEKILTDEYKTFSLDSLAGLLNRTGEEDVHDIPYKIKVFDVCQNAVKAAKTGKIDISKYEKILFDKTIERIGLTEEEMSSVSKDKLNLWDLMYIYKLPSYTTVSDIVKAEILSDDFKKYLKQNDKYGESNIKTRDIFTKTKLKYNTWLNPDKSHEIRFMSNDKIYFREIILLAV